MLAAVHALELSKWVNAVVRWCAIGAKAMRRHSRPRFVWELSTALPKA